MAKWGAGKGENGARAAHRILAEHAGWPYNAGLERRVRLELYKVLRLQPRTGVARDRLDEAAVAWRAGALKETVEAVLRMYRVVAE